MRRETVVEVVTALYTAAGRRVEDAELALWGNVLASTPDDGAIETARTILATVDVAKRLPTPALFLEHRRAWERGQPAPIAIEPPVPTNGAEEVRKLRGVLAEAAARARREKAARMAR